MKARLEVKNGRVLHLAIDEKFIDFAYQSFENVAESKNDFWVFCDSNHSYIKKTPFRNIRRRDRLGWSLYREISNYQLVVLHSLHPFWIPVVNACDDEVNFVWVGWGYDYYDLVFPNQDKLLLPETARLKNFVATDSVVPKRDIVAIISSFINRLCLNSEKGSAIKRIQHFSPVLPDEYESVRVAFGGAPFPRQAKWNYGSLEEVWVKDFVGRSVNGNSILIGNSASYTSNHLDVFKWLGENPGVVQQRRIVCPLSYGDMRYADAVQRHGQDLLGGQFNALRDYMPLMEYVDTIASCSHVLMNHVRQQGVGNLIIMLYLGAAVFLRQESPALTYLRRLGFIVYTIQELEAQPHLLNRALTIDEVQRNRELLENHWSKLSIDGLTRKLLEEGGVLARKGVV